MNYYRTAGRNLLGFFPQSPSNGSSTQALSAAATWLGYSFVAPASLTMSKVKVFLNSINGSLGASDLTCDLYSDSAGLPNASIESRSTLSAVASAGWVEWNGFTSVLTDSLPYWFVMKNANGSPATNFPTYRYGGTQTGDPRLIGGGSYGLQKAHTTNSGSSWTAILPASAWLRIEFSDGSFYGQPYAAAGTPGATVGGIYANREVGCVMTTSLYSKLRVKGVSFYVRSKSGAPSGNFRCRLYTGSSPSLLATTKSAPSAAIVSGSWNALFFSSVQTINPGTVLRIVAGEESNADTSSINWLPAEYQLDSDPNSLALMPFNGTMCKTYFDGTSWIDTQALIIPCGLILDGDNGEFAVQSALRTRPFRGLR